MREAAQAMGIFIKPTRADSRAGTTTVEFAMVVPILFVILLASVEFARANQVANAVSYASYMGCRQAIIPGGTASGASTAANEVLSSNLISQGTVTVSPASISDSTTTVSVTVSVPMSSVGWVFPRFFAGKSVSRTCTLTREKTS